MITTSQITIYALVDPRDGRIFWVGQSAQPEKRYKAHLNDRSSAAKYAWLQELRAAGLRAELRVLEVVALEDANTAEQRWIDQGRALGWPLFNQQAAPITPRRQRGPACTRWALAELATERGMSIYAVAKASKIPYTTVYAMWHHRTTRSDLRVLDALARVLGVQTGRMFTDREE